VTPFEETSHYIDKSHVKSIEIVQCREEGLAGAQRLLERTASLQLQVSGPLLPDSHK